MARGIPNPGAFYAFIAAGINRALGLGSAFLAALGYLFLLCGVSAFFGIVSTGLISDLSGGFAIDWYWMSLLMLVIVGVFGYVGIEFSAKTLSVLLLIEVIIVTIFDVAVLADGGPGGRTLEPLTIGAFTNGNMGLGVMYAIVMFIGFEATAIFREEAKDPVKTIPRATYLSVAFIGLFYGFTAWLLIVAVGADNAVGQAESDPAGMFPGAFGALLGVVMTDIASVFVLTSVFASALACHNIFTRYIYNLGVDHALPPALGRVHPKQASPYVASVTASVVTALVLLVVIISGLDPGVFYGRVAGIASLSIIFLMLLTTIAVLIHFRGASANGQQSIWATRIAPALAALGLTWVIVLALVNANAFMASTTSLSIFFIAGMVVVFSAGVGMAFYLKAKRPDVYARLGRQKV
jgi:amino acid transporter